MIVRTKWQKYDLLFKILSVSFLLSFFFLLLGLIMLLTIKVDVIFNGFNLIYNIGIIDSLKYYEPNNVLNIIFLKTGIVFTFFLMPFTLLISFITLFTRFFINKRS